jgi:hypothetical protein
MLGKLGEVVEVGEQHSGSILIEGGRAFGC